MQSPSLLSFPTIIEVVLFFSEARVIKDLICQSLTHHLKQLELEL